MPVNGQSILAASMVEADPADYVQWFRVWCIYFGMYIYILSVFFPRQACHRYPFYQFANYSTICNLYVLFIYSVIIQSPWGENKLLNGISVILFTFVGGHKVVGHRSLIILVQNRVDSQQQGSLLCNVRLVTKIIDSCQNGFQTSIFHCC